MLLSTTYYYQPTRVLIPGLGHGVVVAHADPVRGVAVQRAEGLQGLEGVDRALGAVSMRHIY